MTPCRVLAAASGLAVSFSAPALAQWSSNPAACLVVGDRSGEQNQAKIKPTADGGCYISWYDNSTGGYDIYLQRLNIWGVEQWPHNGILIADRGVSSTVDYDLTVVSNDAVLIYNDDTVVPGTQQIQMQRVAPAGNLLWGPHGITVSDGVTSVTAPGHICPLSDGTFAVGYTQGNVVYLRRYSTVTGFLFTVPVSEDFNPPTQPLHSLTLSDIQPTGAISFVALFVRSRTNSALSNKSLYAQKFSGAGLPVWTGTGASNGAGSPVVVYDAGTSNGIQNGYFPRFLPDGVGGGVFGWYESGGSRNSYIQHVLTNGDLKFPAPVASTGATPGRIRLGAAPAYNAATSDYYIASTEGTAISTVADSLMVQKIDTTGALQWGSGGVYVLPITAGSQPSFEQCQFVGGVCMAFAITPTSSATGVIAGGGVNSAGTLIWSNQPCSAQGGKARLTSASSTAGFAMLAFASGPTTNSSDYDLLAQNVLPDGTLGNPSVCYANCDSSTVAPALNVADFTCFLQKFAADDPYANCDSSTQPPTINVADFGCFLQKFAAGCP